MAVAEIPEACLRPRLPMWHVAGYIGNWALPIGPMVVPFGGSYLEFYKVIPKRNYYGAYQPMGRHLSEI